ncbi:hypothetical protein PInf_014377 [Phytophthora infestans]|nr:hypothetical protein PInf_014377 [Phytophthora infestans]
MSLSSSYGPFVDLDPVGQEPMEAKTLASAGSRSENTMHCSKPTESWKNLYLEKACNRAVARSARWACGGDAVRIQQACGTFVGRDQVEEGRGEVGEPGWSAKSRDNQRVIADGSLTDGSKADEYGQSAEV